MKPSFFINLYPHQSEVLPIEMIWIPAGSFIMGKEISDKIYENYKEELLETKPFKVNVTNGFWMSKNQITNLHWDMVMLDSDKIEINDKSNFPKVKVSYWDCIEFCEKLNTRKLLNLPQKAYEFNLPTEAQWEYAFKLGFDSNEIDWLDYAWCEENSNDSMQNVGTRKSNKIGINDLMGNCFEWCRDCFEEYPKKTVDDWVGKGNEEDRMVRGTSYKISKDDIDFRGTIRWCVSDTKSTAKGFRLVYCFPPHRLA